MVVALPILDPRPVRPNFAQGPRSLEAVRLLRLSITDRCNFRCLYCMPEDGVAWFDRGDLLTPQDILDVAAAARAVGVDHFKLTGGEPTLRADLVQIVEGLKKLDPADLSLTTNAVRLDKLAGPLRDAGLDRLTVSCDSLQPERFAYITRGRTRSRDLDQRGRELLGQFWQGVEAAQHAGFEKLKFNVVMMGGINDDEAADFARLTLEHPWTIRFIEYMPLGESTLTQSGDDAWTVDNQLVRERIEAQLGPLEPVDRTTEEGVGPANVFRLKGARGRVGFISAMSQPFCETCNRLRLTARGELRACLFDGGEVDLMPALRPADPQRLAGLMRQCVALKPETHSDRGNRSMSQLGG